MPKSITPGDRRVVFNRRVYNIKAHFPQNEMNLTGLHSRMAGLEQSGTVLSGSKMISRNLKRMRTLSLRMMGDLRDAMRAEPELKLPSKVLSMLVFVNLNSQLLLSRLGKVQTRSGILEVQDDAVFVESVLSEVKKSGSFPGNEF